MDVIVRSNNNPVNDMTAPEGGLINVLDNVVKIKSSQSLDSDCSGLTRLAFMSPTRQANPGRLFM